MRYVKVTKLWPFQLRKTGFVYIIAMRPPPVGKAYLPSNKSVNTNYLLYALSTPLKAHNN